MTLHSTAARQPSPLTRQSANVAVLLLAVLCLSLFTVCSASSFGQLGAVTPTFNYYTDSACTKIGTSKNVLTVMNFAIQYPPFNGECTQCPVGYCSPVPYKFLYDNSSAQASFLLNVYGDIGQCNATELAWVLTAKSTNSQISCTPGTFSYVYDGNNTVTNLWYTIGTSGSGGGGGNSGSSGSNGDSGTSHTMIVVIIAVLAVVGIIVVGGLVYWWYNKRSSQAGLLDGQSTGEPGGQYNTLA